MPTASLAFVIGLALMCDRVACAQSASTTPASSADAAQAVLSEFEVATIKPVDPKVAGGNGVQVYRGGRVVISGADLKSLIAIAFNLSFFQIKGGDGWTEKDEYNLEAKAPESAQPPEFNLRYTLFGIGDERLRQMLQALLIDRFQLKFHRETKTGTVYLLELSGKPLKLKPAEIALAGGDPNSNTFGSIGWAEQWVLADTTMAHLAKFGADFYLHCPVFDRTGLAGTFSYRSGHEEPDSQRGEPADSFTNMIQEVGLKLVRTRGPVETFIIDNAEKPSPN